MVQRVQARRWSPSLFAGMRVANVGDSITAEELGGDYADTFNAFYGLTRVGISEPLVNRRLEVNANGWSTGGNANSVIARDGTRSYLTGSWSLKLTATAAGLAQVAVPGGSATTGGDIGTGLNLNMTAGNYQTWMSRVYIPTGTLGNVYAVIYDRVGAGAYAPAQSAVLNAAAQPSVRDVWTSLAAIKQIQAGATEAFVRIVADNLGAGQSIWLDGAFLAHTNGDVRPAIGGTYLSNVAGAGALEDTIATRVAAYTPEIVTLLEGTNDFFAMTQSTYTPQHFLTSYRNVLAAIGALPTTKGIIACGLPPAKNQVPNLGLPSYATSGQDLRDRMNARIRQAAAEYGAAYVDFSDMPLGYTDGIHPDTTNGHPWMAQRLIAGITGKL